jgi:hypothetical protein
MLLSLRRILTWTLLIGGVSFSIGFFGPMVVDPSTNQGPLLGILITGPLGLMAGLAIGITREALGYRAGPLDVLRHSRLLKVRPASPSIYLRPLAGLSGGVLGAYGIAGVARGEGRGAAAAIVIAGALIYYAVTGAIPHWFRR